MANGTNIAAGDGQELSSVTNGVGSSFTLQHEKIAIMFDNKDVSALEVQGGVVRLLSCLRTHSDHGLNTESSTSSEESRRDTPPQPSITLDDRRRIYGRNVLPPQCNKSLLLLTWGAMQDKVLVFLSVVALAYFYLGLSGRFRTGQSPNHWVEGLSILVMILIFVFICSVADWKRGRQSQSFVQIGEDKNTKVIRNGVTQRIDVKDIVVGDIALLEPGNVIPCDGILLHARDVKCDESSATGEVDPVSKLPYDQCRDLVLASQRDDGHVEVNPMDIIRADCFMVSGSKVLEGEGRFLVLAVGAHSHRGRVIMALRRDDSDEDSLLQLKLNTLSEFMAKYCPIAGLLLVIICSAVHFAEDDPTQHINVKILKILRILINAVILIVSLVPAGLPLVVIFARESVPRPLRSHEEMANATVICADMTDLQARHLASVTAGLIGASAKFVQPHTNESGDYVVLAEDERGYVTVKERVPDLSVRTLGRLEEDLSPQLRTIINDAICTCMSSRVSKNPHRTSHSSHLTDGTDKALFGFTRTLARCEPGRAKDVVAIVQHFPPSDERNVQGVAVKLSDGSFRLYAQGSIEVLDKKWSHHVLCETSAEEVKTAQIDDAAAANVSRIVENYTSQGLRVVALSYRDFESWPPPFHTSQNDQIGLDDIYRDLVLICVLGIKIPIRPDACDLVRRCEEAGIAFKVCSTDDLRTADTNARDCGVYIDGAFNFIAGQDFCRFVNANMHGLFPPRLKVVASCSAKAKDLLVTKLMESGEDVVDKTRQPHDRSDSPTGAFGTGTSRNFPHTMRREGDLFSVVPAITWARRFHDVVRKVVLFRISAAGSIFLIAFILCVTPTEQHTLILGPVHMFWMNIVVELFSWALTTNPGPERVLERKPERRNAPLFSVDMCKRIFAKSIYQIGTFSALYFRGLSSLKSASLPAEIQRKEALIRTLLFNFLVFVQLFNVLNCRRIDNGLNVFEGLTRNRPLAGMLILVAALQIIIVWIGGPVFQVVPLTRREWAISLFLGFLTIPFTACVRYVIRNSALERTAVSLNLLPSSTVSLTTRQPLTRIVDTAVNNLKIFSILCGGRVRASSSVERSRWRTVRNEPLPQIPVSVSQRSTASGSAGPSYLPGYPPRAPGEDYAPMDTHPTPPRVDDACETLTSVSPHVSPSSDHAPYRWGSPNAVMTILGLVLTAISAGTGVVALLPLFEHRP